MALLIGIILLIIVLSARSVSKSTDRFFDRRYDFNTEFKKKWAMNDAGWSELFAVRDPKHEHYKETITQLRDIFYSFPHGKEYFDGWLDNIDVHDSRYIGMRGYVNKVQAALHGKLPGNWDDGLKWRAWEITDRKELQMVNAMIRWWIAELQKHGFPYNKVEYVDHFYDRGLAPNFWRPYFERELDIGNRTKLYNKPRVDYCFSMAGSNRAFQKYKQAEDLYFLGIGL